MDNSMASGSNPPVNLLDMSIVDEVQGSPFSTPYTPLTPINAVSVERMINSTFEKVWGQIEEMFERNNEEMRSLTQRSIAKVDEEISALKTHLQGQSSPSTRVGAGDQTSPSVTESGQYRTSNPFNQRNSISESKEQRTSYNNNNFTSYNEHFVNQPSFDYRENVDPPFVTSWSSNNDPTNVASGSQNYRFQPRRYNSQTNSSAKMKPQYYDGSEDLDDYLSQFEILADLNS